MKSKQYLLFLLNGSIAAAVNFASRMFFSLWLDFSISVILAYAVGMATAFFLVRRFVFKGSRHSARRSAAYFCVVNLLGVAQTWGISMLMAREILPWLGMTAHIHEIAHAAGIVAPTFTSYIGHKYWTFREAL